MSQVQSASSPKAVGVSSISLPKRLLSHRYVINDAKLLLEMTESDGLRSPNFSFDPPQRSLSVQQQITLWHLRVQKSGNYVYVYLYQGSREAVGKNAKAISEDAPTTWITDYTIHFINPESGETMYASTSDSRYKRVICNESPGACHNFSIKYADMDKYLCHGTLTVQFEATLFCLTDPIESVNERRKPMEDKLNVLAGNKSLFEDKVFADAMIKCGDAEFKAHKAILVSQSPVFKKMLESDMKEQRTNVIEISDVDQAVISDMLAYFYTGSAPHMDTLVKELFNVADRYELSQLFTMCEDKLMLEMSVENVMELLILADMHNSSYLKKACLNYIYCNSASVRSTSQWKELKKNCDRHAALLVEALEYIP